MGKNASIAFSCILFLLSVAAPARLFAGEVTIRKFDLPADTAEKSLKRLSLQSGVEILFATEMTAGIRTVVVKGEFPVVEAANRALAHTGLVAVQDARTGTLTINRANGQENDREGRAPDASADTSKKKPPRHPKTTTP